MLQRIMNVLRPSRSTGPMETVRKFSPSDATITKDDIFASDGGWSIETADTRTIRLFEFDNPEIDNGVLTFRADVRSEDVKGRSYLEMLCRLPGRGEFFSRGLHDALKGTNDWSSYEISFHLKKGQRPDQIKLNLVNEGGGKLWLRNVELLHAPYLTS